MFSEVTTVNSPQEECLNVSSDNEKERRHLNTAILLTNATAIFHGFIFLYLIMKEDKKILGLKIYLHIAAIIHSRLQIDGRNPHYVKNTLFLYFVTLKLLRKQGDIITVSLLCLGWWKKFFINCFIKFFTELYVFIKHYPPGWGNNE